jgi:hypothetical protein
VLGIKPSALHMLSKHSTTELLPYSYYSDGRKYFFWLYDFFFLWYWVLYSGPTP